jgi:hypothetical protein
MFFSSNWGTESDPDSEYHNGNSEPRGYGMLPLLSSDLCMAFQLVRHLISRKLQLISAFVRAVSETGLP